MKVKVVRFVIRKGAISALMSDGSWRHYYPNGRYLLCSGGRK